ncbi:hypothetical protein DENSPDRAFT_295568 [Dentipellis sp. KUC8613]|nr:hypothetical protein DENSPDRAFT_295568 [Dentipellis sp. KUC8613]
MMLTGAAPSFSTLEMHAMPGPSSCVPYGDSALTASQPTALSRTATSSSYDGTISGTSSTSHTRAQEKAARAATAPRLRRQLSDEIRKKKRAEKAKRKRDRDVEDRINLNSVLPEDRQAAANPPGLVEVIRESRNYILELKSELDEERRRNSTLQALTDLAQQAEETRQREHDAKMAELQQTLDSLNAPP